MRRSLASLFLVGLIGVVAGACGGDSPETIAETTTPPAPASSAKPSAAWVVAPGKVGPITVGLDGGNAKLRGFAKGVDPEMICGHVWIESDELAEGGIHLDFRNGDSDDLDQILVSDDDPDDNQRPVSTEMRTAEGVGIGTPFAKVRQIYGDRLVRGKYVMEGGGWTGYTVFGPDGAMTFDAGSTEQDESDTVLRIFAVDGEPDNFDPPGLGC